MRRSILLSAIGLLGAMLGGQLALAQQSSGRFVVPRPLLSDPPPASVASPSPSFHFEPQAKSPAPSNDSSGNDNAHGNRGEQGHRNHDDRRRSHGGNRDHGHGSHGHHHHGGDQPLFVWPPIIYPWPGNVGYIPRYPSYYSQGLTYGNLLYGNLGVPLTNLGQPFYVDPALGGWSPLQPAARPQTVNVPAPANSQPTPDPVKPKIRATNAATKARAGKFIGYGDANFKKQKYLSAAERYKDAARMAPDLADSFLRQGFAFIAMGNYESAARVFRRGLAIRSDWNGSPFRLDQIYGDDQITKTSHIESLAKAAEDNPLDANLIMLLGLMLYFDGQGERSEPYFAAASQVGGNSDRLLDHFLAQPRPAGVPANDPPKAGGKLVF